MRSSQRSDEREIVQSVERAFDILRSFSAERPALSVSEIATHLSLNRTTVYRLLTTLEACGAVRRDSTSQKFMLASFALRLSNVFLQQYDVRSVGLPFISKLRDETNHTSALHIRDGYSRITIAQMESRQDLRVAYPDLGQPIPLHLGGPGKVILAYMDPSDVANYLNAVSLEPVTPFSPMSQNQLQTDLENIQAKGYVITKQERRLGVVSIAAPVFDATGRVIASVNVSGPVQRISDEQAERFAVLVVKAGREISNQLGYFTD